MTGPDGLQTVNVLVTDMVGSTSTLVRAGADAADAQRHRHDTIVAQRRRGLRWLVVKSTGDGALALLPSADHLVRAGSASRRRPWRRGSRCASGCRRVT